MRWLVLLQGDKGALTGTPKFVEADSAELALSWAYPTPPSTRQVLQALVIPVAGSWVQIPAWVPAPEWQLESAAEYGNS